MSTTSSCTVHAHRGITRESGILTWLIERTWILHSNYWLTWSKYPTYLNWFSTEPVEWIPRFRPKTQEFLKNVSKMFELHVVTFGARLYAHTIASFLDPKSQFFSHRILSRDECFDSRSKVWTEKKNSYSYHSFTMNKMDVCFSRQQICLPYFHVGIIWYASSTTARTFGTLPQTSFT